MKNRILTFIIGVLVGAILTTLGFLIYTKVTMPDMRRPMMNQDGGMRPPEFPSGEFNGRGNMQRGQR